MRIGTASSVKLAMLAVFMIVVSCGTPCVALAAGIEKGQVEISGSGGTESGVGIVSGAVGAAVTSHILAGGDFSYIPSKKLDFGSGYGDIKSKGYGFSGGVQYTFPLSASGKLVPYVAGGLSYLRYSVTASYLGYSTGLSMSGTGLYVGGGLRYYVSDRWGIRPELTFHTGSLGAGRFQVGVFYQFGK